MRPRVLVREKIAQAGIDLLRERFDVDVELEMTAGELERRIGEYDGLVVRSATRVTAGLIERAGRLKVIGRAGTGVDNVDVEAATRRGIVVANAPGSNMVAAAELAVGLMLALVRNIPQAHAALKAGHWERSRFGGVEVAGKTLGVVGFGRIGQLVAARARGLGMHVLAHDPFVSAERFRDLQARGASLEELLAAADVVSLHAPLTEETRGLIGERTLRLVKPGVRIVNTARGPLIELDALVAALRDGRVAAAALDVFPEEPYTSGPILELENVVVTPHLGASTREAQDRAGVVVAEQVAAALEGGIVANAVNAPHARSEDLDVVAPFLPLATQLGRVAVGLCDGRLEEIDVGYSGALAETDTRVLTAAVLAGAFSRQVDDAVNLVNAHAVAQMRGIRVREGGTRATGDFTNLVTVRCGPRSAVSGTVLGREQRPWLVEVHGRQVEIELSRHMLVLVNDDRPGMIGAVGTLFGEEGVNIANMTVSRNAPGEEAVMVLNLDTAPAAGVLERVRALEGFHSVRLVSLDGA